MSEPVIRARGVRKVFREGPQEVSVLLGVYLDVQQGESVAIVGASGSGKSTLLHLLGGLDAPSAGEVLIQGKDIASVGEAEKGRIRNQALGFVYQFHHLLQEFSAQENVAMPLLIRRRLRARREARLPRCSARSACLTGSPTPRASYQAVSVSGRHSPVAWSRGLLVCWPTSLPATSIVTRPRGSWS